MLFNSIEFAVFFSIVIALYYALRARFRVQNALILGASYVFYGWWDVRFLYLIVLSTVVDYCAGLMIDRGELSRTQRLRASLMLVVPAFLFVVVRHGAIRFEPWYFPRCDWTALLPEGLEGWWVLMAAMLAAALANLAYPVLKDLDESRRRRLFMLVSVAVNLLLLGVFKYFNFFGDSLAALLESVSGYRPSTWTLDIVLPVGISFYTFQTMSYTIDVYRRQLEASDDMVEFAAYVAFFPQLVAGPIERGKHLLPQFRTPRPALSGESAREGAWLIAWGLFKKMVVADNMAVIANRTFEPFDLLTSPVVAPEDGLRLLVGVYAFAFQIYGDFSGYTDIARGTSRLMGFDIMLNFHLPYFATSPTSFWRRWHISLSSWLRDYLYIALGGNRGGTYKTYRNLCLTMLLGGLWHGAAWTFVIWGAYHGALLVAYRILGLRKEAKAYPWWSTALQGVLMFHLTCVGWLIFRAQNVTTIGVFLQSIVGNPATSPAFWADLGEVVYFGWFLVLFQVFQGFTGKLDLLKGTHWFLRLNVWIFVIMSLLKLASEGGQEFIYFAF